MFEIVHVDRPPESASNRLGRRLIGGILVLLGAGILLLFTRALITELTDGTFYGLVICLLVLVFGALVTRDGLALAADRRIQLRDIE